MSAAKHREATRVAQTILRIANDSLVPDGWWGSYTDSVYRAAPDGVRKAVDESLVVFNVTQRDLRGATNDSTRKAEALGSNWIAEEYLRSLLQRASAIVGVDEDVMFRFLRLEAAQKVSGGVRYYDASSVAPNGLYHGLLQMGRPAWQDVQRLGKHPVPAFEVGRYDPWQNVLAGAQYILINQGYARSMGYTGNFTPEVLYAMHNQGAGGFVKIIKTGVKTKALTVQSKKAQAIIAQAASQNGVSLA